MGLPYHCGLSCAIHSSVYASAKPASVVVKEGLAAAVVLSKCDQKTV